MLLFASGKPIYMSKLRLELYELFGGRSRSSSVVWFSRWAIVLMAAFFCCFSGWILSEFRKRNHSSIQDGIQIYQVPGTSVIEDSVPNSPPVRNQDGLFTETILPERVVAYDVLEVDQGDLK